MPHRRFELHVGRWQAALIAAVLIAVAAGALWVKRPPSGIARELVDAFEAQRYRSVEARLMGGFAHRPMAPLTRGSAPVGPPVIAAALTMQRADRTARDADTVHELAVSYLLLGSWDAAVDAFDEALRLKTQRYDRAAAIAACTDATLLNDASAAYHAHARARNRPESFVVAAEAAQRAWALDKSPETAWNRAVTAESLHQRAYAIAAWREYLEIDGRSDWAAEARQRMRTLARPSASALWEQERERLHSAVAAGNASEVARIVRAFPFEARMLGEQTYLAEWAAGVSTPGGVNRLQFCRAVGAALQEASGESMLADTVADIDRASATRRAQIIRGLLVYGEGRRLYKLPNFADASEKLSEAFAILRDSGSPFAAMARMYVLSCARFQDDRRVMAASDEWLTSDPPDEQRYPALLAQIRWVRGLSSLRLGRPEASIEEYRRALAIFERLGESSNRAFMHVTLSEGYDFIGNTAAAWMHRFAALEKRAAGGTTTGSELEVLLLSAAAAVAETMPAAAIVFLDDVLRATNEPSLFDTRVHALVSRAAAHRLLGNSGAAEADVRQAGSLVSRIVDPAIREQSKNSPEFVSDRLSSTADMLERERILQEAIDFASKKSLAIRLAQLYLLQGRDAMRAERWSAAEKALFAGLDQLEQQRDTIVTPEERRSFVGARQALYDTLAGLLCDRGDSRRAFDVVESSRARTLLDGVLPAGGPAARPRGLRDIQSALEPGVAIVQYAQVGEGRGVWVVSRMDARYFRLGGDRERLQRLSDRLRVAIRADDDAAALSASRALHDELIAPWYAYGGRFERLVFVPDQVLTGLPFGALHDGSTFLIERHPVATSPSANLLLACIENDRVRAPARIRALVVAPSTSVTGAQSGVRLSATQDELTSVASRYPDAVVLDGARATRANFVERAAVAEVIHFGGHTTSDRETAPRLLFASNGDGAALMHAADVRALRLTATRVVMLAACDSGTEASPLDDGASSIARAFLAAGAPVVIASYWPVEDEGTAALSRRFHAHLSGGNDPVAALRSAQLDMLASRDARNRKLGRWAAFAAIGGTYRENTDTNRR